MALIQNHSNTYRSSGFGSFYILEERIEKVQKSAQETLRTTRRGNVPCFFDKEAMARGAPALSIGNILMSPQFLMSKVGRNGFTYVAKEAGSAWPVRRAHRARE